jgi:arginase
MNANSNKTVRIIGVPMDLGAGRRGTNMGPSALRVAGLGAAIRDSWFRHVGARWCSF